MAGLSIITFIKITFVLMAKEIEPILEAKAEGAGTALELLIFSFWM